MLYNQFVILDIGGFSRVVSIRITYVTLQHKAPINIIFVIFYDYIGLYYN